MHGPRRPGEIKFKSSDGKWGSSVAGAGPAPLARTASGSDRVRGKGQPGKEPRAADAARAAGRASGGPFASRGARSSDGAYSSAKSRRSVARRTAHTPHPLAHTAMDQPCRRHSLVDKGAERWRGGRVVPLCRRRCHRGAAAAHQALRKCQALLLRKREMQTPMNARPPTHKQHSHTLCDARARTATHAHAPS